MTIASNHQFSRHAHDQYGIGVIQSGAQRSWSGIGPVEAVRGNVIMVNPGEMHDGVPIDYQIRKWRMIYFDPKTLAQELADEVTGPWELINPVANDPLLARHFDRLFTSLTNCYTDYTARDERLLVLLFHTLRKHGTAKRSRVEHTPCVKKAIRRLDAVPEIPVSLQELAVLSGMSRFQLVRAFTRAVGITPHAYLVQRRVQLAKRLLARGHAPAQAALQAGFADQSHMTRAFLRQLGVTPSRYQAVIV